MRLTSLVKRLAGSRWRSTLPSSSRLAGSHGVPQGKNLVRGFGAREIAAGAAVLAPPNSSLPFLARAAGDVLDLGAAGLAIRKAYGGARRMAITSAVSVIGFLALDLLVTRTVARASRQQAGAGPSPALDAKAASTPA